MITQDERNILLKAREILLKEHKLLTAKSYNVTSREEKSNLIEKVSDFKGAEESIELCLMTDEQRQHRREVAERFQRKMQSSVGGAEIVEESTEIFYILFGDNGDLSISFYESEELRDFIAELEEMEEDCHYEVGSIVIKSKDKISLKDITTRYNILYWECGDWEYDGKIDIIKTFISTFFPEGLNKIEITCSEDYYCKNLGRGIRDIFYDGYKVGISMDGEETAQDSIDKHKLELEILNNL